jgi:hypothetical protein
MNEDKFHEDLVQAYLQYFAANEWWDRKNSVRAYSAVQKALRDIRSIAKERNTEIRLNQKDYKTKFKGKLYKDR